MSKTIPAQLLTHLQQDSTTLATCWRITRFDSTVYRFTDHDEELVVGAETFKPTAGYSASAVQSTSDMSVDNLEIVGIIDDVDIDENDLIAGLFNDAFVEIFMVNFEDTTQGILELRSGWLGDVTLLRGRFVAELRGLAQRLGNTIGESYSWLCRAELGDSRCQFNFSSLPGYTYTGVPLSSVIDQQTFILGTHAAADAATGWWNQGKMTWTAGLNTGLSMEIAGWDTTTNIMALFAPMPFTIQPTDQLEVFAGCDKSIGTCSAKFANVLNFRGEPFIPGIDRVMRYVIRA